MKERKTRLIKLINIFNAFVNPNGINHHSYKSSFYFKSSHPLISILNSDLMIYAFKIYLWKNFRSRQLIQHVFKMWKWNWILLLNVKMRLNSNFIDISIVYIYPTILIFSITSKAITPQWLVCLRMCHFFNNSFPQ